MTGLSGSHATGGVLQLRGAAPAHDSAGPSTVPIGMPVCGGRGRRRTHPPLLVLLARDHDHFPLQEGQLVVIVRLAVVNGLHSPHLILPLQERKGVLVSRKE